MNKKQEAKKMLSAKMQDFLQQLDSGTLAAIAMGRVDIQKLAQAGLAARGQDEYCAWIGFAAAKLYWKQVAATEQKNLST